MNRPIYLILCRLRPKLRAKGYAARFCRPGRPDICLTARTNSCFAESSPVSGAECQAVTPTKVLSWGPNAINPKVRLSASKVGNEFGNARQRRIHNQQMQPRQRLAVCNRDRI
jgi:hypothetical protein